MLAVHVVPLDDLIRHEVPGGIGYVPGGAAGGWLAIESDTVGEECGCRPSLELMPTDRGDRWLVTHHSLDGREAKERERAQDSRTTG